MLRVGLIGVSGYGAVHYRDLMRWHRKGRLRFTAATVINPGEEAEKCAELRENGVTVYHDYHEMLRVEQGRIELCCIPTGIPMHAPMATAAMRAGANVMLEKPAAATIQEVEEMRRVEKQTGKFVAVAYQDIYRPEMFELKDRLLNGMIGPVRAVSITAVAPASDAYYRRNNWAGRLRCGDRWVLDSPFNNSNAHQVNLALFLCGKEMTRSCLPVAVAAELYRAVPIESADTASILLQTESFPVYIAMTRAACRRMPAEIVISGDRGGIVISNGRIAMPGNRSIRLEDDTETLRDRMLSAIIDRCRGLPVLVASLDMARAHTICVNGAHESSPVVPIPSEWLEDVFLNGDRQVMIRDIHETISRGRESGKMFSEINPAAFRGKSRMVDLRDYSGFAPAP